MASKMSGKGGNSAEMARKGLSKSAKELAPHKDPANQRALELQGRFNAMKSINAPSGQKSSAKQATPMMVKHGGAKSTPTPKANKGEASQVRFGQH